MWSKTQIPTDPGTPGTGKIVTGALLAYILAKLNGRPGRGSLKGCVVYFRPSNNAVDVVHNQLSKTID